MIPEPTPEDLARDLVRQYGMYFSDGVHKSLIRRAEHERKRADAAEREAEKWRSLSPSDNMTVVLSHERHEELIAAERERDEARKCLVEMSVEAGTQQGHRQLAEAEVERLRALLERAKPMVADWLNHDSAEGTLLTDIDAALEAAK